MFRSVHEAWQGGSKISIPIRRKSNHAQEGIRVFLKVGWIALCLVWFSLLFASKGEAWRSLRRRNTYNDSGP